MVRVSANRFRRNGFRRIGTEPSQLSSSQPIKRLDSVRFHYILLDECAEFSFVCGSNQCMLLHKKIYLPVQSRFAETRFAETRFAETPP